MKTPEERPENTFGINSLHRLFSFPGPPSEVLPGIQLVEKIHPAPRGSGYPLCEGTQSSSFSLSFSSTRDFPYQARRHSQASIISAFSLLRRSTMERRESVPYALFQSAD
ncbi:Uncharacterized protein HZ326_30507, partial [Fusarium oxysporum f. sp. albedinis]